MCRIPHKIRPRLLRPHWRQAASRFQQSGGIGHGLHSLGDGQQRRQPGAVIRNAGTAHIAVAVDRDIFFCAGREHGIEMRGERDQRACRDCAFERGQNVAGAIDPDVPADRAELRGHPFGALLFEESGRGNAAKLQVNVVHPLLLSREPLQRLADTGPFGHFAGSRGRGQEISRHISECKARKTHGCDFVLDYRPVHAASSRVSFALVKLPRKPRVPTALGIRGGRRAGVGGHVVFNLLAKSLPAPRNEIQLSHDLVGCFRFTRIFGNAKLPLQPKPFHRGRFARRPRVGGTLHNLP